MDEQEIDELLETLYSERECEITLAELLQIHEIESEHLKRCGTCANYRDYGKGLLCMYANVHNQEFSLNELKPTSKCRYTMGGWERKDNT